MKPFARLLRQVREQPLSYRMLAYTLLCSLLVTTFAIALQLHVSYRADLARLQTRLDDINSGYVPSLSASVWAIDRQQIALMLDSIARLPDVALVELASNEDALEQRRVPGAGSTLTARRYPLTYQMRKQQSDRAENVGRRYELGELRVEIGSAGIIQRLRERALGIVVVQALTIFLVSLFVFALVQRLIARRLQMMAAYARTLDFKNLDVALQLPGQTSSSARDEIEQVAFALNRMREGLLADMEQRDVYERELAQHRDHLEELAAQRTSALEQQSLALRQARDQAERALVRLQSAQQRLVEAEKMASLGQLVAGVAHEVNTPLGIALTASSFLRQQSQALQQQLINGGLSKNALQNFVAENSQGADLVLQNLERAARLVQNFKQVSVDRGSDGRRVFAVEGLIQGLIESSKHLWKHRDITLTLDCAPDLTMDSFPGALGSVLSNLIQKCANPRFSGSSWRPY